MKIKHFLSLGILVGLSLSMVVGMYVATRDLPPYTWLKNVRYLLQGRDANSSHNVEWSKINYDSVLIKGLPGFSEDGDLSRLPNRISSSLREPLRSFEKNTAGGIATFVTNATKLKITALINSHKAPHMTDIMSAGVDVYENGRYSKSFYSKSGFLNAEMIFQTEGSKTIDVYLPLYGDVKEINFFVEEGSESHVPKLNKNVVLYYGSSITQGCCASNPGMSYPAIVSRKLGVEQINLGFSGNGLGDLEIAKYITELNPKLIVLDYWANPSVELYRDTLPVFIEKIRYELKDTPIVVTSTFANPGREDAQRSKDEISESVVLNRRANGDANIYFVDGLLNEDEVDGLVDSRHLNSYGFHLVAAKLSSFIAANKLIN